MVQDLRIQPHNTRYRLEVWQRPGGERLLGELPASLNGGHVGPELRRDALYQHHHCHVTQPLLHEQLHAWGIDISAGQINALLSGANAGFFAEKGQRLVLTRPDIVLHTNGSEGDIRGCAKWRKIRGGTRSDLGKRCRDGFAGLKKTCRKLGVSFWDHLGGRIGQHGAIAPLPDIIREHAAAALAGPRVFEKLRACPLTD